MSNLKGNGTSRAADKITRNINNFLSSSRYLVIFSKSAGGIGQFEGITGIDLKDETAGRDEWFVKSSDKRRQNIKYCGVACSWLSITNAKFSILLYRSKTINQ